MKKRDNISEIFLIIGYILTLIGLIMLIVLHFSDLDEKSVKQKKVTLNYIDGRQTTMLL